MKEAVHSGKWALFQSFMKTPGYAFPEERKEYSLSHLLFKRMTSMMYARRAWRLAAFSGLFFLSTPGSLPAQETGAAPDLRGEKLPPRPSSRPDRAVPQKFPEPRTPKPGVDDEQVSESFDLLLKTDFRPEALPEWLGHLNKVCLAKNPFCEKIFIPRFAGFIDALIQKGELDPIVVRDGLEDIERETLTASSKRREMQSFAAALKKSALGLYYPKLGPYREKMETYGALAGRANRSPFGFIQFLAANEKDLNEPRFQGAFELFFVVDVKPAMHAKYFDVLAEAHAEDRRYAERVHIPCYAGIVARLMEKEHLDPVIVQTAMARTVSSALNQAKTSGDRIRLGRFIRALQKTALGNYMNETFRAAVIDHSEKGWRKKWIAAFIEPARPKTPPGVTTRAALGKNSF